MYGKIYPDGRWHLQSVALFVSNHSISFWRGFWMNVNYQNYWREIKTRYKHASITDEKSKHDIAMLLKDSLFILPTGQIRIPQETTDLHIRLLLIAHTSTAGDCGQPATVSTFSIRFHYKSLEVDTKIFITICIPFVSTTGGWKIPPLFGPAVIGTKPNDLFQFHYLDLGKSTTTARYVLMIWDNHSATCVFTSQHP